MAQTHVSSALKVKRVELAGEIKAAEDRVVQLRADLAAPGSAMRVFDPSIVPAIIRPRLRRRTGSAFPHGKFSRIVLTVLRRAGKPLTTRAIAAKIAADYHVDV